MAAVANPQWLVVAPPDRQRRQRKPRAGRISLPGLRIHVLDEGPILLVLTGRAVTSAARTQARREFVQRLFSIAGLQSLKLRWRKGEAQLEFDPAVDSVQEVLELLAAAMRRNVPVSHPLLHEEVILGNDTHPVFEIWRVGPALTFWRIDQFSDRFFRLSHPLLSVARVRKAVLNELAKLTDAVQQVLPISNSLLVMVRPHRMEPALFREILDPVLTRYCSPDPAEYSPRIQDALVNANLALAPVADFLFPPVGIANAAITGMLSHRYVPAAVWALKQGKTTIETLNLVIAVLTVVTFEFFPATLMHWLMRFWPRRTAHLCETYQGRFLARYLHRPHRVWVEHDGNYIEMPVDKLRPSSVINLTAGDVVPGDGLVVGGSGLVNERLINGDPQNVAKRAGSYLYAATRVMDGSIQMQIVNTGEATVAAKLSHKFRQAILQLGAESGSRPQAERTVLPTLLAGAAALLPGGLNATKAVLRPDYLTGPAISEEMIGLAAIIRAANEGILIGSKSHLEILVKADHFIFDSNVSWREFSGGLGELGGQLSLFATDDAAISTKARQLGFDKVYLDLDSELKRELIEKLQRQGQRVVYVGNCEIESAAASQADLAISLLSLPYSSASPTALAILTPDLEKILQLRALAVDLIQESRTAFRITLLPNVLAAFAAIFLRTPALVSVLLTNLGTFANYARSSTILELADRERTQV